MKQTGKEFDFEVIARGAFITDLRSGAHPDALFRVEAINLRLNNVAFNDYIMSTVDYIERMKVYNVLEGYPDGEEGDKRFELHKKECKHRREVWEKNIIDRLGLEIAEKIIIKQTYAEIFTVVYIEGMKV
jgi:hypothetical protein